MVEEEEQDQCQTNFHHICFILSPTLKTLQKLNTTKHISKYDIIITYIKFRIDLSSDGIHPLKLLFATFLLKTRDIKIKYR